MKTWYAWATPSGPIRLIEGDKMPVKDFPDFWPIAKKAYEGKLQAAKESSVPIQDQFQARLLIYIKNNSEDIKPDTIYGPFTVGYRIRTKFYCQQMNGSGCTKDCEHVPGTHDGMYCFYKDKKWEQVAILYDDTPEKEESWVDDPVFSVMEIARMESMSAVERYGMIKEKFTITRK